MKYKRLFCMILSALTIFFVMSGCQKSTANDLPEFSVTQTVITDNTEKLKTSVVYVSNNDIQEKYCFKLTAQYPLGCYDKNKDCVYYTQRDSAGNDNIYLYNCKSKKNKRITDNLFAVNNIFVSDSEIYICAAQKEYVSALLLKDNIINKLTDDSFNVYAASYNEAFIFSGFDGEEDYRAMDNANMQKNPKPYAVKNTIYKYERGKLNKILEIDEYISSLVCNSDRLIFYSYLEGVEDKEECEYLVYNIKSQEYEDNSYLSEIPDGSDLLYLSKNSDIIYYLTPPDDNNIRRINAYCISENSNKTIYCPPDNYYINNAVAIF